MIFDELKENAIYTAVSTLTGITTIWYTQDRDSNLPSSPKPDLPFCVLGLVSGPSDDGGVNKSYKETDTYYLEHKKLITISANIYSITGHMDYADKLSRGLSKETILAALRDSGLVVRGVSNAVDLSILLEAQHERRAMVEIDFAYSVTDEDEPGEIAKVGIEKTNDPTYNEDIE